MKKAVISKEANYFGDVFKFFLDNKEVTEGLFWRNVLGEDAQRLHSTSGLGTEQNLNVYIISSGEAVLVKLPKLDISSQKSWQKSLNERISVLKSYFSEAKDKEKSQSFMVEL